MEAGIGKLGTKEIEHLNTFEKDERLYYRFKVNRNSLLRSSILSDKIQNIGKIEPKFTRFKNLAYQNTESPAADHVKAAIDSFNDLSERRDHF